MIVDEQLRHVPTARRASKARSAAARAASASRFCSASASFRARSASAARARAARLAAPPLALGLVFPLRGLAPRHGGPVALPLLVRLPDELALARASLDGLLALQRLAPRLARRARRLVALPRGAAWARGRAEALAGRRRRGRRGGRLLVLEPGHLVVGLGGARGALADSSAAAAGAAASGSARPGMSSSVSSSSDATWSKRE